MAKDLPFHRHVTMPGPGDWPLSVEHCILGGRRKDHMLLSSYFLVWGISKSLEMMEGTAQEYKWPHSVCNWKVKCDFCELLGLTHSYCPCDVSQLVLLKQTFRAVHYFLHMVRILLNLFINCRTAAAEHTLLIPSVVFYKAALNKAECPPATLNMLRSN